jgi:hypothetical protein
MDGDREPHWKAAPWRAWHAEQPGGSSADHDGLAGWRDRRARICGPLGGRLRVGRQRLLGRCCDDPCLTAARSLAEVNETVLAAGAPFPSRCCVACPPTQPASRASL